MKRGFTLIELLIVVAIIAILAAIALPNFLEAQIRAKVSRAKSDFRTIAVALESYAVDHNTYVPVTASSGTDYDGGIVRLTSPIAYLTSIPSDAFGMSKYKGEKRWPLYELGAGDAAGQPANDDFPVRMYLIESNGPDNNDDTSDELGVDLHTGSFPWPSLARDSGDWEIATGLIYDPTNGTASRGDLMRSGGIPAPNPATLELLRMMD